MRDITPGTPKSVVVSAVQSVQNNVSKSQIGAAVGFAAAFFLFGFGFIFSGLAAVGAYYGTRKLTGESTKAVDYYDEDEWTV